MCEEKYTRRFRELANMSESYLVKQAEAFATRAHEGQTRSGQPPRPYITHPLDVMRRLREVGADDVALAAAVLHDVVEDCGVPVSEVGRLFGWEVASVVEEVSDPEGMSKPKAKARQVAKAPTMSRRAKLVKLADKTSNVHDVVENPPDWRPGSVVGYARSAVEVVDALGEVDARLDADFRAAAARALESGR